MVLLRKLVGVKMNEMRLEMRTGIIFKFTLRYINFLYTYIYIYIFRYPPSG